jgi:hypothetical protein
MTALLKGMAVAFLIVAAITLGIFAGHLLKAPDTCVAPPVPTIDYRTLT